MTYNEARELTDVSPSEAEREIKKHGISFDEFQSEVGKKEVYTGKEIFDFLGY